MAIYALNTPMQVCSGPNIDIHIDIHRHTYTHGQLVTIYICTHICMY